jgi:hypothetical protein
MKMKQRFPVMTTHLLKSLISKTLFLYTLDNTGA